MHKRALIILLALPLLFQACSKKIVPLATQDISKALAIQEIDFEYFHGKARLNFNDGKKEREVKANIRVRKDSVIWMTFSVIGVQGGKALINHDSITIVSTVDKEYFVFDYAELSKRFNFKIDYHVIQSAFLGNLILPRSQDDKVERLPTYDLLTQQKGSVLIKNYINASLSKIEKVELTEVDSKNAITLNYTNFQAVENKIFPYNGVISLVYKTPAGVLNNVITFEYNKAEVGDRELRFPFNIPRKYDRR
ncbi:MAG: DUF4292 domain-containing protein [Cyclobacteriaceae bacterium]|mgnify:CR=1 FL=1|nr:DUF4292 domain-containing protein [Cyclobacteriaceae bacterium]MCB9237325.1 DUF4292 domain-containing protein [Flammeovirgaceae bacterium]MCB0500260.1 DUF4292 domain-containing protein [Cyclobacteriaceae bacterium]MCO5271035.1 DUF4292 domain-containing protein [Cyclobacteriaceae bacterium]MCW5903412.1 DUF4292 domain-containing protein [Cyclobacteriaceae bacterium]